MTQWKSLSIIAKEMKYDSHILKKLCQESKIIARKKGRGWQIETNAFQDYTKKNTIESEPGYQKNKISKQKNLKVENTKLKKRILELENENRKLKKRMQKQKRKICLASNTRIISRSTSEVDSKLLGVMIKKAREKTKQRKILKEQMKSLKTMALCFITLFFLAVLQGYFRSHIKIQPIAKEQNIILGTSK